MATIVRGTVPASEFALSHTLEAIPELTFETERIVTTGEDAVMPLLWVRGIDDEDRLAAAREADPSVDRAELLAGFETE